MFSIIRIVLLLISSTALLAQLQLYKFEHIGSNQGLAHGTVYSATQDAQGFIWFGTEDGLQYYDGNRIRDYQANRLDSEKFIDISRIFTSSKDEIWTGLWGKGLLRINPRSQEHIQYKNNPDDPNSLSSNSPQVLHEDSFGNIWVGCYNGGLNLYDPATDSFIHFEHDEDNPNSISHNHVWALTSNIEADKDGLWIGTYGGLDRLDIKTGEITRYPQVFPSRSKKSRVRAVYLDSSGDLWVGTRYFGIKILNIYTGVVSTHEMIPDEYSKVGINHISQDNRGNYWIGSKNNGLWTLNSVQDKFYVFDYEPQNPRSISFSDIRHIYEDNAGIMWISTRGGGVNRVNPYETAFQFWTDDENLNPNSRVVTSIYQDEIGKVWLGTKGGLLRLNENFELERRYQSRGGEAPHIQENEITVIQADRNGGLWVGTDDGLDWLDPEKNRIKHYVSKGQDPESLSDNSIRALLLASDTSLWVGTYRGGLNLMDPRSGKVRHFRIPDDLEGVPSDNAVLSLFYDPVYGLNNLWVGTSQGLLIFHFKDFTWEREYRSMRLPAGDPVRYIHGSENGTLVVGENSQGIILMDTRKSEMVQYTIKDGLPGNTIQGIVEDNNRNYWITTSVGICEFNPTTKKFMVYNQMDGIQGNVFSHSAVFRNKDGTLFAGGVNGLTIFDPDERMLNTHVPPVYLTSFSINNIEIPFTTHSSTEDISHNIALPAPISGLKELVLSPKDQFLSFEFAALDYANPRKNQFAVMLEGLQDSWNYIGDRKQITYSYVPPGDYHFKVKATNSAGLWNEKGTSIRLIIEPSFYQTTWFRVLLGIGLISTIIALFIVRLKFVNHRNTQLEELVQMRTIELEELNLELGRNNTQLETAIQTKDKFFSIISHDLRGPLGVIMQSLQTFVEMFHDLSRDDIESMIKPMEANATKTYKLMENLLSWSRLQTGSVVNAPELLDMAVELQNVVAVQVMRAESKEIKIHQNVAENTQVFVDPEFLGTILRNLISNAIKFTPRGGHITIDASSPKDLTIINIADNGVGIPKEKQAYIFQSGNKFHTRGTENEESSGLGLILVKEFVEAASGEISLISKEGLGSTFQVVLPKNNTA